MAIYPTSSAGDSDLYIAKNGLSTLLSSSVDNVVTTIPVTSTTGFPSVGYVVIDSEVIKYTSTDATNFLSCTRGSDGTSASSHTTNALVKAAAVADHHNALKEEIKAIETDLTNLKASITSVTATDTATNALNRIAMLCNQIKEGFALTNWYDQTPTVFGTNFRNRIINGDMRIDQRNAGASYTVNASAVTRLLDRWNGFGESADGVFTVTRLGLSNNMPNYMRAIATTADASIGATQRYIIQQKIEGFNISDFNFGSSVAKTITLSFWVRSTLTGTFGGSIQNSGATRNYVFSYTINSASTWEYKTIVISGDTAGTWLTDNGIGLSLNFSLGSGADYRGTAGAWGTDVKYSVTGEVPVISTLNASFDIGNVQIEAGSVATPFEHRPIQTELALCQRYFWKSFDQSVAVAQNSGSNLGAITYRVLVAGASAGGSALVSFPVVMRPAQTLTFYNPSANNANWRNAAGTDSGAAAVASTGDRGFYVSNGQVVGDALADTIRIHATAEAEL